MTLQMTASTNCAVDWAVGLRGKSLVQPFCLRDLPHSPLSVASLLQSRAVHSQPHNARWL